MARPWPARAWTDRPTLSLKRQLYLICTVTDAEPLAGLRSGVADAMDAVSTRVCGSSGAVVPITMVACEPTGMVPRSQLTVCPLTAHVALDAGADGGSDRDTVTLPTGSTAGRVSVKATASAVNG